MSEQKLIINLNDDFSENIYYISKDFPMYIAKSELSAYPDYGTLNHWHTDIEFIVVLSGRMKYNINGEVITLYPNEALFVNSRQMHFGFSDNYHDCTFICIVMHPVLLCSSRSIEEKYIKPILSEKSKPYYVFRRAVIWENELIDNICDIYNYHTQDIAELKIQSLLFEIWMKLFKHMKKQGQNTNSHSAQHLHILKKMLTFIQENYTHKITLEDIAKAGFVGKTTCCNIFKKYTTKTPIDYLNRYRIEKSLSLLKDTNMSITQIGFEVGFSGTSYFSEIFRNHIHMAPNEYRKLIKNIVTT